jgi:hypothetical protein
MVSKNLVETIHGEVVQHLDEAKRLNDSPRLIAVLSILERLTNLNPEAVPAPPCKHEHVEQGICQQCGGEIPSLQLGQPGEGMPLAGSPESCPHSNINPFGVCRECGTCLHQFRSAAGVCHQCGDVAKVEADPEAA